MADKAINDLTQALQITNEDLFVLEQGGTAKKLKGETLLDFVTLSVVSVTVTTLPAGSSATATYDKSTGTLALGIPQGSKGDTGATGATGPANVLTIGSVTSGKVASATITGEAPNQVLNLVLKQGEQGDAAPTITNIAIRQSDYHMIVTLSDGTSYDAGYCRGASGAGTGDMIASIYDPQGKTQDIFAYVDAQVGDISTILDNINGGGSLMGTIADKLNLLLNTKAAIKAAIIGKGQTVADSDPFSAYPAKIQAIETGIQLPTLTNPGTAADMLAGKELIDQDGNPLTGTMPSLTAQTITPGVSDHIIAAGRYLAGDVTVSGDSNLVASNIKSGVNIFGVNGNYSGQYKFNYFSGITPYSSTEFRIPVDSDIAQVVGLGVKLTNNFEAIQNEMVGCMWWDNGTVNGGNMGIFNGGGSYGMTFNLFSSPIPIGGTSSNKYAQLMMPLNLNWSSGHAHEGFIFYKV